MPKLLYVDDEINICDFAKSFFTRRGVETLTAIDGTEALKMIDEHKPDLVLLDVSMEGLSGVDVLKRLREDKNDVPVIMVSRVDDEAVVNEANSWGIKGYIHKPLVLDELEQIVLAELNK